MQSGPCGLWGDLMEASAERVRQHNFTTDARVCKVRVMKCIHFDQFILAFKSVHLFIQVSTSFHSSQFKLECCTICQGHNIEQSNSASVGHCLVKT